MTNTTKTIQITPLEHETLKGIVSLMYAEWSFSDVGIIDVCEKIEKPARIIRGVLGSLSKKGLIELGEDDFEGIIYLSPLTEGLHIPWIEEGAAEPVNLEVKK